MTRCLSLLGSRFCSLLCAAGLLAWASQSSASPQAIEVLDAQGQPLAQAAVSVTVRGTVVANNAHQGADMAQRNKRFAPTLLVVQTGTAVNFPNFDTVRHHVYSFSSIKPFEIKLYAGTPASPVVFDKPGTATLGCNIHDTMLGYIHVVDTPYFGVTDAQGSVSVDPPNGEHRVRVWHPSMTEASPGQEFSQRFDGHAISIRLRP